MQTNSIPVITGLHALWCIFYTTHPRMASASEGTSAATTSDVQKVCAGPAKYLASHRWYPTCMSPPCKQQTVVRETHLTANVLRGTCRAVCRITYMLKRCPNLPMLLYPASCFELGGSLPARVACRCKQLLLMLVLLMWRKVPGGGNSEYNSPGQEPYTPMPGCQ